MSCTLGERLALFEKLTRYFKEKVSDTCWFISITTPSALSLSSSVVLPFLDLVVLGFLLLDLPEPLAYSDGEKDISEKETFEEE